LKENIKTNNHYFKNYVAASASLYYHDQYLLQAFQNITDSNNKYPVSLYLTVGEREINGMNTESSESAVDFHSFAKELSKSKFNNIKVTTHIFSNYGHMDTPVPTFTDGLKLILKK
jgi:predicted alpha/beta superfamily hydrolase